jgi:hypothetical protein
MDSVDFYYASTNSNSTMIKCFQECYSSDVSLLGKYLNVKQEGEWNSVSCLMLMREQQQQEALWVYLIWI